MALFGSFDTIRTQAPKTPGFAIALAYVEDLLRPDSLTRRRLAAEPVGDSHKYELGGGVFVIEQAYAAKARPDGFFEAHRRLIDVQVVLEGAEVMEVADIGRMTVQDPYDESRDLVTFTDRTDASALRLGAGDIAVFFPSDVHMPGLRVGAAPTIVRKAVVKIPVGG